MKVTVGAIRQIVREEAERLNEVSDSTAAKDMFIKLKDSLKGVSDARNPDLDAWMELGVKAADKLGAQFSARMDRVSKILLGEEMPEEQNESYSSDELRNMIMAEANNLLGE